MTQNDTCPAEVLRLLVALEGSVLPAKVQSTGWKRVMTAKVDILRNETIMRGKFKLLLCINNICLMIEIVPSQI